MSDPFVAEIRIFPFNFPPTGWAFCNGQLLPISQNTALFSLLGTYYGGDGKSTFALPDLQGCAPMQQGQGSGLSPRYIGESAGVAAVTLIQTEIPVHTHYMQASAQPATAADPTGNYAAQPQWDNGTSFGVAGIYTTQQPNVLMAPQALSVSGSSLPHDNMQPYLALNFCIALQGIFPPRG